VVDPIGPPRRHTTRADVAGAFRHELSLDRRRCRRSLLVRITPCMHACYALAVGSPGGGHALGQIRMGTWGPGPYTERKKRMGSPPFSTAYY
jgi:hypothetical protein